MTLTAGTRLGRYEIRSPLGRGGMGEVYLARDPQLERTVALKVLPPELSADRDRMRRFIQEARAAAALNHPHIAHIYEVGEANGTGFIAMEFIDGDTLHTEIHGRRADLVRLVRYLVQAAEGVAKAHRAGIIHLDLKPDNIMVTRDGYAKVLDFGLAKIVRGPKPQQAEADGLSEAATVIMPLSTPPGAVVGTVFYMSPEQARGEAGLDQRSDIFSFGCILYEAATRRRPFAGDSVVDTLHKIIYSPPAPLTDFNPDAPAALQRIVRRCLAKDPEERYQTIKDVALELKDLLGEMERLAEAEHNGRAAPTSGSVSGDEGRASVRSGARTQEEGAARHTSGARHTLGVFRRHRAGVLIGAAILLLAGAAAYVAPSLYERLSAGPPPVQRALTRVTFDAGLQSEPAWSPDGRFIAYSSDRGGNFDIWVQPVSGGDPVQVTRSPAHDWQPDWSPDGDQIVFRSEREGGGLFVAPALGGRERRISSFGHRPLWSPDGSLILFVSSALRNVVEQPRVYVVALDASPPREVQPQFFRGFIFWSTSVVWHPDGRRISTMGRRAAAGRGLWTVPLDGGAPVQSEPAPEVERQIREAAVTLDRFRWAPSGRALYFEGRARGVTNLWRVTVEPETLRWIAGPERLTTGTGEDSYLALSPDGKKLAFTARTEKRRIWSLPFEARTGRVRGAGEALTAAGIDALMPDLSADGKKLAFLSLRGGEERLWEKSLADGREILLAADDFSRFSPHWSRDGSRLVYRRCGKGECVLAWLPAGGGGEQVLTSPSTSGAENATDWSPDGASVLAVSQRGGLARTQVWLLPVSAAPRAETQAHVVTSGREHNLWQPRFSPDGRWISFNAVREAGVSTVYVVPAAGGEWVRITDEEYWADKPRWSPDGKALYFVSNRGTGLFDVWGVRFDPAQGKPAGEPFRVTHFESPGQMIDPNLAWMEMAISEDRLVVPILEVSGSVWMLENVDR